MPSDHPSSAVHAEHNGHKPGRLHRFVFPAPKLPPPITPDLLKHAQERADARRQVIADAQWKTVKEEDRQNKQLIDLSEQILSLTKQVRAYGDTVEETLKVTKALGGGGTPKATT